MPEAKGSDPSTPGSRSGGPATENGRGEARRAQPPNRLPGGQDPEASPAAPSTSAGSAVTAACLPMPNAFFSSVLQIQQFSINFQ